MLHGFIALAHGEMFGLRQHLMAILRSSQGSQQINSHFGNPTETNTKPAAAQNI
jgi:hypothetical protein